MSVETNISPELLLLLAPLVVIEVLLIVAALWDLTRPGRRVRGNSRALWAVIILLVSTIGPILYFLIGREEAASEDVAVRPPAPSAVPGWLDPSAPSPAPPPATGPTTTTPAAAGVTTSGIEAVAGPAEAWIEDAGQPAIACHALSKRYAGPGGGVLALDSLDLAVPAGSVFGLLGPNGAGKTTTLRILAGLTRGTAGSATVGGAEVGGGGTEVTRRIGFLDQDPRFYGWLTGRETVDLVGRLHGIESANRALRTAEVLAMVELSDAADRRVATYSGGMRQRLGIAQALVNRPPVLILDEPVSSLDPEGRRDLLALIAGLRGHTTVLFSTHVLDDVERVCDRVAIVHRGRLVVEGPLAELLDRFALPIYRLDPEPGQERSIGRLVDRLRAAEWATDVAIVHGAVQVTVSDPGRAAHELLATVVEEGIALATYERLRPSLEDVFLRLVGRDADGRAA